MTIGPELPVDPPAEVEIDPELRELVEQAARHRDLLESDGINLSQANLLTPVGDLEWETHFEVFDRLILSATNRLGKVSRERKEAAEDYDIDFDVKEADDVD